MSKPSIREAIEKLQEENDVLSSEIKLARKKLERAIISGNEKKVDEHGSMVTYLESKIKDNVDSINALMEVIKNG